jgi:transcriptional regulator with XRE-family HTH domain
MLAERTRPFPAGTMLSQGTTESPDEAAGLHISVGTGFPSFGVSTGESSNHFSQAFERFARWLADLIKISPPITGGALRYTPVVRVTLVTTEDGTFELRYHLGDVWLEKWPELLHLSPQAIALMPKSEPRTTVSGSTPPSGTLANEAQRLKNLSGLEPSRLADIVGVTKTAYYDWLNGRPATSVHRQRLLEVLSLFEEAAKRLGSADDVSAWLLKPVAPRESSPLKLLAEHHDDLFYAALLQSQARVSPARPLISGPQGVRSRPEHEVKRIGRQRRRPASLEDYE